MAKRKRTLGVDRAPGSGQRPANPSDATVRTIPLIFPENECSGAVAEKSYGSDNDHRDGEVGPNDDKADCEQKKTNRLSHDVSSDDSWYIEFLDKRICIKCNEGGEVLVCSDNGCPVVLHAKCLCCEPEFDDRGNFYCPYCWFKQAVAEVRELRRKALKAKEALSCFLDKIVTTGDRSEKKESVAGDEGCLNCYNRHGNDGVNNQTFHVHGEEKRETDTAAGTADPDGIAVEGEAHANASVVSTVDFRHYGGQRCPVPLEPIPDSRNREKFDTRNISETHESRFFEGGERIETEVLIHNDEKIQKSIGKDILKVMPLSVYRSGEYADGQALDAFAKKTQEGVAISAENKNRMNDEEKELPQELKVSATASSVSETDDSDSEALSLQKNCFKQKARKTAYSEKVDSGRKTQCKKSNYRGKNALIKNEGATLTNCKTLGQLQGSPKQVKDLLFMNSRKRLRWTAEEENMLKSANFMSVLVKTILAADADKKGVEMFAKENQNTPWRKILEYGCNVFDLTRTPVDLKDKWRNIVAKEGWK